MLAVAAVSRLLSGTPVTSAMVFVLFGVLVGPRVLDGVAPSPTGGPVRTLAEATLAVVLFSDASGSSSRRCGGSPVPLRLLGIGLPLTIALGGLLAAALFDQFTTAEALVLAVVLAPTDAALGQAVVTEPRLPSRIRQGLNVESGLNDGICVPLLLILLASAEVQSDVSSGHHALTIVSEEIGYGILGGVAGGVLGAAIIAVAGRRRHWITGPWLQVDPRGQRALAYGLAAALGGSGFIAAFLAGGLSSGALRKPRVGGRRRDSARRWGGVLDGVTFVVFGAILLGPSLVAPELAHRRLRACSASPLSGCCPWPSPCSAPARAHRQWAFLGWFGPRGLASIVFAVIVVQESHLPQTRTILLVTYVTVGLSVLAHGLRRRAARRAATRTGTNRTGGTGAPRWKASRPQDTERAGLARSLPSDRG